ncbi:hypothetical protein [Streptomyces sp. ODS28]|uniref:hypothetical protein n=1 Tax=Streptomyces sp. ODS28 TaxID=3136688 RepID=UPI0031E75C22
MDAQATPPPEPEPITASVTVTGEVAGFLRDLAAIEGRTPEELVLDWAAGKVKMPSKQLTAEDLEVFDGPEDLSSTVDETLERRFGRSASSSARRKT